MTIYFLDNGRKNGMGFWGSLFDFFFPYRKNGKCEFIRCEAKTSVGPKGIYRSFFTFRALFQHYAYEFLVNPLREICRQVELNPLFARAGAIAFDVASGATGSAVTSLTFSHTCTGTNRLIISNALVTTNVDRVTGVTYAAASMTRQTRVSETVGTNDEYMYYLIAPATGANDVVWSFDSSQTCFASAASYTGVAQSGFPDASNTGTVTTGTSITVSVTTVADNCWLVSGCINSPGGLTAGTNTTNRNSPNSQEMLGDSNVAETPPGSFSQNYTWATSGGAACAVVSIAPGPVFVPKITFI